MSRNPEIALKLVAGLVRRLRAANMRLSRQSFQTVPSRVAGILAQLSRDGQDGDETAEVTIRMNQTDLAQLAGTSRESVSRFLAELERAGVVRSGRGPRHRARTAETAQLHLLGRGTALRGEGQVSPSLTNSVEVRSGAHLALPTGHWAKAGGAPRPPGGHLR